MKPYILAFAAFFTGVAVTYIQRLRITSKKRPVLIEEKFKRTIFIILCWALWAFYYSL